MQLLLYQLLSDENAAKQNEGARARHEAALAKLNAFGPLYAQEFKTVTFL